MPIFVWRDGKIDWSIRCARRKAAVGSTSIVQAGNVTPLLLNRKKSVIPGIHGPASLRESMGRSSSVIARHFGAERIWMAFPAR
jgi:hypothetical protein